MKALADLWNEPLRICASKGKICAFAITPDPAIPCGGGRVKQGHECALDQCAFYKRERRKYESNRSRPR